LLLPLLRWVARFRPPLTVVRESGPSHLDSGLNRARRMVSEDSFHRVAALAATVHGLAKSQHGDVVRFRQTSAPQDRYCVLESREVLAFVPTSRKRSKKGTTRSLISERSLTSQYQPPLPALRMLPQPNVSRNSSRGARSFWETLKAAESFHLLP